MAKRIRHKLQYFRNKRGKWHWRFIAVNGKKICSTEDYSSITKARESAKSLIASIQNKTFEAETIHAWWSSKK